MSTGTESPQSMSITGYYKGFSVILTKRDEQAKIKPLIDSAMEAIDYMLENSWNPSWNKQTNDEIKNVSTLQEKFIQSDLMPQEDYVREPIETSRDIHVQHDPSKKNWKKCPKHGKWFDADKYSQCFECNQQK